MIRYFEKTLCNPPEDDLKLPDADLHLFEKIVAYDHLSNKAVIILNINKSDDLETKYKECEKICNEVVETLRNYKPVMKTPKTMEDNITVKSNITKEHYLANVEKAKEYIKEGDIFQIVPSQRFEIDNPPDRTARFAADRRALALRHGSIDASARDLRRAIIQRAGRSAADRPGYEISAH